VQTVEINISSEELARRAARLAAADRLERPDRIPVLHYIGMRYLLPKVGMSFGEYFSGPRAQVEAQLKAGKWLLENIHSDYHRICVWPDYMFVEDAHSFGAEIVFPVDDGPWVARPHALEKNDNLDDLRRLDVLETGFYPQMIRWYREMKSIASDYEVRFADGACVSASDYVLPAGAGTIGLLTLATDLCGVENLSVAFYERPDWVHEMLDILLEKSIEWMDKAIELGNGRTCFCSDVREQTVFIGDDALAQMSRKLVEQFARPRHKKLADYYHARGFRVEAHNCGKADHLLDYWYDEIGIDRYYGISYLTDKRKLAALMGGKIPLVGGVSTQLLSEGTPQEVTEHCREAIELLAPQCAGGFVLMDGHNVAPGTPVENLNAMMAAAERYGRY
jgi:uroporphyrinogen-III decarboxylase